MESEQSLIDEISGLIEESKCTIYANANSATVLLFWKIGESINRVILQNQRADYGKEIVVTLARQLEEKYGKSFEEKNLRRMLQFAEQFSDEEIVVPLARQLSWSHFLILLPLKTMEEKLFYARETVNGQLGNRLLKRLVAVELKQGQFQAEFNGQMKLYLKWLNRYERQEGENEPIGLILCAGGNHREQIELLEMDKDGIMVAEYWTTLPPKEEFETKIHTLMIETRERLARHNLLS
jgi:predicted nuclease of restriction endonuclease-like (RecB) superfamily